MPDKVKRIVDVLIQKNIQARSFSIASEDINQVFRHFNTPITGLCVGYLPHLIYYPGDGLSQNMPISGNHGLGGAILGISQRQFNDLLTGHDDLSWFAIYQVHPVP